MQVRAAIKVKASVIICFTSSGRAARSNFSFLSLPFYYFKNFLMFWSSMQRLVHSSLLIVNISVNVEVELTVACYFVALLMSH